MIRPPYRRSSLRAAVALLAFCSAAAALAAATPDTMEQRVAACTSCHGARGEGSPDGVLAPPTSYKGQWVPFPPEELPNMGRFRWRD